MLTSNFRPRWWQLYLTLPLLIALFAADSRLKISTRGHQAVQTGIVLLVFGLVHLWLKANSNALTRMDQEYVDKTFTVFQIPASQLSESNGENRQILQLPESEIKGVLSDTFEMDYIDAEALPIDEVPDVRKKE